MTELPLLINTSIALVYALVGGLVARRLGLPTIVGYLLAGVALGPFVPGFYGDEASIHQLAEFGVILLMFGVGTHFSFRDLWKVRDIAVPGALLQTAISTGIGYALARYGGATPAASLVLGVAISVASTVVLLRGLMDNGLLESLHGRVAVGWLVLEDLLTVVVLVLLPLLAVSSENGSWLGPLLRGRQGADVRAAHADGRTADRPDHPRDGRSHAGRASCSCSSRSRPRQERHWRQPRFSVFHSRSARFSRAC